jgi:hypothetical protein
VWSFTTASPPPPRCQTRQARQMAQPASRYRRCWRGHRRVRDL